MLSPKDTGICCVQPELSSGEVDELAERSGVEARHGGRDWPRRSASMPPPPAVEPARPSSRSFGALTWVLRAAFAAAVMALIGILAFYLIDRDRVQTETRQAGEITQVDVRDARQKIREASALVVEEACEKLRIDYEVWKDYLDKKTRRKLKGLMARCPPTPTIEVDARQ